MLFQHWTLSYGLLLSMIPTGHYALSIQNGVLRNQLALKTWCPGINKHPLGAQAWLVSVVLNVPNSTLRLSSGVSRQVLRAVLSHVCVHTPFFFKVSFHRMISRQHFSPCPFYNAGLDYNLRPASWSAIWGTLITQSLSTA